eukprot:600318-Karenia_brevis.AAC.1
MKVMKVVKVVKAVRVVEMVKEVKVVKVMKMAGPGIMARSGPPQQALRSPKAGHAVGPKRAPLEA